MAQTKAQCPEGQELNPIRGICGMQAPFLPPYKGSAWTIPDLIMPDWYGTGKEPKGNPRGAEWWSPEGSESLPTK